MRNAFHRRGNYPRLRVENLEARALLSTAGSLDPTFGNGYGFTTVPLDVPVTLNTTVKASSVAVLPDGNILVSGETTIPQSAANNGVGGYALTLAELNPTGTPDTSFGTNGVVQLPIENGPFLITVEPDGKILDVTTAFAYGTENSSYLAVRLNANGSLDTTFGTNGFAEYPADSTTSAYDRIEKVAAVLIQSNGQIVLAGTSLSGYSAVRLNSDGSLDTTYGTDGTATVFVQPSSIPSGDIVEDTVTGAAIQANGQVVLEGSVVTEESVVGGIGYENTEIGVIRLNTDGSLDTSYGGSTANGFVLIPADLSNPTQPGYNNATGVALQPTTGDLLVLGLHPSYSSGLYRLNADGTLDTTFGNAGEVVPDVYNYASTYSLGVEPDGDILVTASVSNGPTASTLAPGNLELLQLNPDGSPDTSFGNTSTPGLILTRLSASEAMTPAVQPLTGDIFLASVGTVPSVSGLGYGFTVDSVLHKATTGLSAVAPPLPPPADFSALGYSYLAVYDPTSGSFLYHSAISTILTDTQTNSPYTFAFGPAGVGQTIPAMADYQGLGYDQIGAYLPASGVYAIEPSPTSPGLFIQFGAAGAGNSIPAPADYEGTGKADVAVYLTQYAGFAIIPSDGSPAKFVPFGTPGVGNSIPAPADYFGTGQADIAVYLTKLGSFAILNPTNGQVSFIPFGKPGLGQSIPVPGDYDGSGKTELAVYIPSQGAFYYRPADGGPDVRIAIGIPNSGEIPVPGDYDGSGRTEAAIYDPTTGVTLYQPAKGGPALGIVIGTANDGSIPVATPPGDLPEFVASGLGAASNAVRAESVPSIASGSGSTASITVPRVSSVPAGPTLASVRVARSLINQAAPDPIEMA